ncbi:MAG: TIGR01777 family oxidoreductase, partial [Acidobacteria bacterium]|nr:TIGR01777 family oxidoreductase [Acidobacteriota bacterium]
GHVPVALSRNPERALESVPALAGAFAWDLMREPAPAEAFDGVNAVIHLAGESVVGLWTAKKRAAIVDSRVVGTRNLLRGLAAAQSHAARFIGASAVGYYGDRGNVALTETSPPGTGFLAETCLAWEAESRRAAELGMRTTILRIGVVLESDGGALGAMLLPFKLCLGGPLGNGEQWWSWIHRDDLVGLILQCLQAPEPPATVNATSPNPVKQKDFAKTLGRVLGRPAILPAPAFAIRTLLGGFSDELLSSKRVLPAAAFECGYSFLYSELEPALIDSVE